MIRDSRWLLGALGLVAIALLAVNLRTPVSSFSPITPFVERDIPLSSLALGVIGMLPPLCFAASGFIARPLSQRFSLESIIVVSLGIAVGGFALRAFATDALGITIGTAIALLGLGTGNVLMPPIVKARFPKRIGLVSAMYIVLIAVSASAPPLLGTAFAAEQSWRWSLGFWGAVALCAMIPWIILWFTDRRSAAVPQRAEPDRATTTATLAHPARSRTAWSLVGLFAVCSLNSYAVFAWLPQILVEHAGLEQAAANVHLTWFGVMGIPVGFLAPVIAGAKHGRFVRPAAFFGVGCFIGGYLLLLAWPDAPAIIAVSFLGAGQLLFSMSLALVGMKSATVLGAARLSSFVQGVGYIVAAGGPFVFAMIHTATGTWNIPIIFLVLTGVAALPAAYSIGRPNDYEQRV